MFTLERGATVLDACLESIQAPPPPPNSILNVWFQDNKGFRNTAPSAIEGLVMSSILTSPLLCVCVSVHGVICSSYSPLPPTDPQDGWVTRPRTWACCCCGNISIFFISMRPQSKLKWPRGFSTPAEDGCTKKKKKRAWVTLSNLEKFTHVTKCRMRFLPT